MAANYSNERRVDLKEPHRRSLIVYAPLRRLCEAVFVPSKKSLSGGKARCFQTPGRRRRGSFCDTAITFTFEPDEGDVTFS